MVAPWLGVGSGRTLVVRQQCQPFASACPTVQGSIRGLVGCGMFSRFVVAQGKKLATPTGRRTEKREVGNLQQNLPKFPLQNQERRGYAAPRQAPRPRSAAGGALLGAQPGWDAHHLIDSPWGSDLLLLRMKQRKTAYIHVYSNDSAKLRIPSKGWNLLALV